MQVARIKRGASFKATLTFEADEWAAIYPWTAIAAEVGQGARRTVLAVAVDAPSMRITVTATPAQTALWVSPAPASFDVWVTQGAEKIPVPASSNIPLLIIDGITE